MAAYALHLSVEQFNVTTILYFILSDRKAGVDKILCCVFITETMVCEQEYKCNGSGRCIPHEWVCDGDEDCVAGDDENPPEGCPMPIVITCPPGHFTCPLLQPFEEKCVPLVSCHVQLLFLCILVQ